MQTYPISNLCVQSCLTFMSMSIDACDSPSFLENMAWFRPASCFKRLHPQGLRKPGTRLGARIQRPHGSSLGLGHAKLTDQAQRQQDRGQGVRQRLGSRSARSWPAGVGGSWGAQSLEERDPKSWFILFLQDESKMFHCQRVG